MTNQTRYSTLLLPIMPMALWSVVKETPGVYRFQAIQTAPEQLKVRLQTKVAGEEARVWELVKGRVQSYLGNHGLENVYIVFAPEPPTPNPLSGKFRHVWVELRNSDALSQEQLTKNAVV